MISFVIPVKQRFRENSGRKSAALRRKGRLILEDGKELGYAFRKI
jgi:hypothetical protein